MIRVTNIQDLKTAVNQNGEMVIAMNNNDIVIMKMEEYREKLLKEDIEEHLLKAEDDIRNGRVKDAIYWTTTKKLLIPRIYNEQSKFNKEDTIICHFCKRLLLLPYPHTENYKQWQVEEIHKYLKCYSFDNDLNEYLKLKEEYNLENKRETIRN